MVRSSSLPTVALVLCVRDEAEFLAANLRYHHALGVSRAYVFLDRCRDESAEVASAFPWATVLRHDRPDDIRHLPIHLTDCANRGLALARRDGMDWLLFLDADEFARGDGVDGQLPAMLADVSADTDQLVLPTREVAPEVVAGPFWHLRHFQVSGIVRRPILDPHTGELRTLGKWIGHNQGKALARTRAALVAISSHRWGAAAGRAPVPTEQRGWHYHYVVTSGRHWHAKYRQLAEEPATWQGGKPVPFPKQCWKELAVRLSPAEADDYYRRWVAFSPRLCDEQVTQGLLTRDDFVRQVLSRS